MKPHGSKRPVHYPEIVESFDPDQSWVGVACGETDYMPDETTLDEDRVTCVECLRVVRGRR